MDIFLAESRDRLRQEIDAEISSLEESTRALKSRRNALAPISCLPPETLAAIFSFLSPEWNNDAGAGYLEWICITHVCRRWREAALNHLRLWSHINLTKLAPAAMAEILSRAKMAPLHLEADLTNSRKDQIDVIERQLEAHISHTRHLCIRGHLQTALERLVSSAPILESLSLSQFWFPQTVIPVNLFNHTIPSLTSLKLDSCDISWKSPLLKGLQTLEMLKPSTKARPKLEDWLDALNDMPQLETLILQFASPTTSPAASLIPEPTRTVTLPSLTKFHIFAAAKDCALALAHLVMPALTSLQVDAKSLNWEGEDVRVLIPYVARNVHGLQSTEPLRSMLISSETGRIKVVAWTTPGADVKECNPSILFSASIPTLLMFDATGSAWYPGVDTEIIDALLMLLPLDSVSTLTAQNHTVLSKEFWLSHAQRWPSLEQASLVATTIKGFRDMLAEDAPPDGPRLPLLTKLILDEIILTLPRAYDLRDMLIERAEQGVPLEVLDLRTSFSDVRSIRLLREVVVEMQETLYLMKTIEGPLGDWHVQGPWFGNTLDGEDEDEGDEEGEGDGGDDDDEEGEDEDGDDDDDDYVDED